MSEAEEPAVAAAPKPSEEPQPEAKGPDCDTKKAVKFEQDELTFDEAQAEIDAIKARAGQARENLKTPSAYTPPSSTSYGSYSSSSASAYAQDEDAPKSKNMLSHLNSHSAMLNYKVQAARSLVRKQEDLLRNLARMRENMERSENEIGKASDYYSSTRHQPSRGYFERRAESAPFISRRPQVREVSPSLSSIGNIEVPEHRISDKAYSPTPISISTNISTTPATLVSSSDYAPDEEFEREMAAIRKRVANLSKQATEVKTPKYNSYDYGSGLPSSYPEGYNGIYTTAAVPEVKASKSYRMHAPSRTHYTARLPATTPTHSTKHVPVPVLTDGTSSSYPRNSYTDYLMESLNSLEQPTNTSTSELHDLYADPLAAPLTDCSLAY